MSVLLPKTGGIGLLRLLFRVPILVAVAVLAFALHLLEPAQPPPNISRGMVTFTFDDGYESTYTVAYPILDKYGLTGTVYVIPSLVGTEGHLTLEQLHELADAGWEIGSHTMTHPDLTEISLQEAEVELAASKAWLEGAGFRVDSFACPYGEYNDAVVELVKKYYLSHRTSWPRGFNQLPLDGESRYRLKNVWTDNQTTAAEVKEWVDKSREARGWLILSFHRIGESGEYNWEPEQLEAVAQYVSATGRPRFSFKYIRAYATARWPW